MLLDGQHVSFATRGLDDVMKYAAIWGYKSEVSTQNDNSCKSH